MSIGTKLGKEEDSFQQGVSHEKVAGIRSAKATTKIGEISEFEKSLDMDSERVVKPREVTTVRVTTEPVDEAFESQLVGSLLHFTEGDIVQGVIRSVEKSGLMVDVKYKSDGFVSNAEISFDPKDRFAKEAKIGDPVNVLIERLETKEGYLICSRKKAEYEIAWQDLVRLSKEKEVVGVTVQNRVGAGLIVNYKGLGGFVPTSQLLPENLENIDALSGESLDVIVLQVDRKRRKIILSNKLTQSLQYTGSIQERLEKFQPGDRLKGMVSNIKDFGAFVDVGGVEGLVHISEISWSRIKHPSEILSVGQELDVYVISVDVENKRLSLGYKRLQKDPWELVAEKFQEGQVVKGIISRIVDFGAFVKLTPELEGLVHISEIANQRISSVSDLLTEGQEVNVQIIKLQPREQRIGLSMKAVDNPSIPKDIKGSAAAASSVEASEIVAED